MAAIAVQDDTDVARHRPPFELIKEPALVNPIKKTEEQRCGLALSRWRSRGGRPPDIEPGEGRLVKG
jgi:hypothetical protein